MRIVMREACLPKDRGSIGCHYIMEAARRAGYSVDYDVAGDYDVELVSVHHCEDFLRLAVLPKIAPIRIAGGHVMASNCLPAIPYADAICIGEGETWIAEVLGRLERRLDVKVLRSLQGTLICADYHGLLPEAVWERFCPRNPPYLNRAADGHARVWYLELARGCPYQCHYCELGNTVPYRPQNTDWLINQIHNIDRLQSSHISLLAPDEASHPGYNDILRAVADAKLVTMFGSVRADQVARRNLPFPSNMLLRVGLDGLTETTRAKVGKPITNNQVVDYFRVMSDRGHNNFKVFLIVGYPWETSKDVNEWVALWERIRRLARDANAHVRVKVTPLIPQPKTPLAGCAAHYDLMTHEKLREWFYSVAKPLRADRPGWFIEQDGRIMSHKRWRLQCQLTAGGVNAVREAQCLGR